MYKKINLAWSDPAINGLWSLSPSNGTIASTGSSSTTYSPPATKGSVTLNLKFAVTGDTVLDSRPIEVFEDHLARDYANFGTGGSCNTGWHPVSKYGVNTSSINMSQWNCYGSVKHAYNNSGNGYTTNYSSVISGHTLIQTYTKASGATFSSSSMGTLQRGDIIVYDAYVIPLIGTTIHAQTVKDTGTQSTYAANNEPLPASYVPTWKWAVSVAGEYANIAYLNNKVVIKVYR